MKTEEQLRVSYYCYVGLLLCQIIHTYNANVMLLNMYTLGLIPWKDPQ